MAFLGDLIGYSQRYRPAVLAGSTGVPTLVDAAKVTLNTGTAISGLSRIVMTTEGTTIGTARFYPSVVSNINTNNIVFKWPDAQEEENLWTKDWD